MFRRRLTRDESNFLNRLLTRYPLGCSVLLLGLGTFMLVGAVRSQALNIAFKYILLVGGAVLVLFGALNLVIWIGEMLFHGARGIAKTVVPPDPDLAILLSSPIVRPGYEQGKTEMAARLVEKLNITREEARQRIDRLEHKGKLVYAPSERWEVES